MTDQRRNAEPDRLCDNCDIIQVEERLIEAERDLEIAKERIKELESQQDGESK